MDNSIDKQFIITEVARVACVPEDKVKVAVLNNDKRVLLYILEDVDVDELNTDVLDPYIRRRGYAYQFYAGQITIIEVS